MRGEIISPLFLPTSLYKQKILIMEISDREKDIQKLCQQVLNAYPSVCYNLSGADSTTCPFCSEG